MLETKLERLRALLFGPPKSGKTISAHSFGTATRTLDFDDGMLSVFWAIRAGVLKKDPSKVVFKTLHPPLNERSTFLFDVASDTIDKWLEEEDQDESKRWDTLIVDSCTFLNDAVLVKAMSENNRLGLSSSWKSFQGDWHSIKPVRMQDWGSAGILQWKFMEFITRLKKNVIVVAHEYHVSNEDGATISISPLLIGQQREKIPALFDEVWYQFVEGSRLSPKYKIQTAPDNLRRLGSRLGCLNPVEPADIEAIRKKVSEFYGMEVWNKVEYGKNALPKE